MRKATPSRSSTAMWRRTSTIRMRRARATSTSPTAPMSRPTAMPASTSDLNAQSDAKQIIDGDVAADVDDSDEARSSNVNVANGADVAADGNAGVNVAAGHYNAQSNIATI